jgi:hypothetical protein
VTLRTHEQQQEDAGRPRQARDDEEVGGKADHGAAVRFTENDWLTALGGDS